MPISTTRYVSLPHSSSSLGEGDPIRATGAKLPKGKLVKIQAQMLEFLEVSDPKAVSVYVFAGYPSSASITHLVSHYHPDR